GRTEELLAGTDDGFLFVNLVDTDMLYGHRRDPEGYASALREIDRALPAIAGRLRKGDLLALTADHGCDPTFPGTDHTRERVPIAVYAPGRERGANLGERVPFADPGATVAEHVGLRAPRGEDFLAQVTARPPSRRAPGIPDPPASAYRTARGCRWRARRRRVPPARRCRGRTRSGAPGPGPRARRRRADARPPPGRAAPTVYGAGRGATGAARRKPRRRGPCVRRRRAAG